MRYKARAGAKRRGEEEEEEAEMCRASYVQGRTFRGGDARPEAKVLPPAAAMLAKDRTIPHTRDPYNMLLIVLASEEQGCKVTGYSENANKSSSVLFEQVPR